MKAKGFTCIEPTPEQWAAWQKVFAQVYESVYQEVPELQGLVAEARQLEK